MSSLWNADANLYELCFGIWSGKSIGLVQKGGKSEARNMQLSPSHLTWEMHGFVNCTLYFCFTFCVLYILYIFFSRNAYELQTSDILLVVLLLKASFPTNQKLEDLFARSYSDTGRLRYMSSMPMYIRTGDGDRYESASEGHDSEVEVCRSVARNLRIGLFKSRYREYRMGCCV